MSYQGARARPLADESGRCFEVSKVRIDADGRVVDVWWGQLPAGRDRAPEAWVLAPVAEVVDAMHDGARVAAVFVTAAAAAAFRRPERLFVVVDHGNGGEEGITLAGPASPGRELIDLIDLDA